MSPLTGVLFFVKTYFEKTRNLHNRGEDFTMFALWSQEEIRISTEFSQPNPDIPKRDCQPRLIYTLRLFQAVLAPLCGLLLILSGLVSIDAPLKRFTGLQAPYRRAHIRSTETTQKNPYGIHEKISCGNIMCAIDNPYCTKYK